MELIDLSPLKPMLMRSLSNPEAIKVFINYHLGLLGSFGLLVLWLFIIGSLLYFAYLLWKNKEEKSKKKIIKKSVFEYLHKVKKPLRKLRYLIIGGILITCAWLLVSSIFHIYTRASGVYNCSFSPEENKLLGYWAFLSLIIFFIAPLFIMFCFGNKFIRNIGILIYIFGIGFIAMGRFISIGCIGMENEEKMDETRKIEVVKAEEMAEIGSIYTEYQDNYDYIMPDNAEISVEDTIIVGEATNLKITMLKDGSTMTTYSGAILITITDENGDKLKDNEYTLPSRGVYQFLLSDLGEKEFQKGLEIKKEGTYYIEIEDLNEYEDKLIGRQKIVVTKKE